MKQRPNNVYLNSDHSAVMIIDQTQLPNREVILENKTPEEMFVAIKDLKVRGAPAIGIFAAFAIYVLAKNNCNQDSYQEFYEDFMRHKSYLDSSRPTAVNLSWALNRMEDVVLSNSSDSITNIIKALEVEAKEIQAEDIAMCKSISENGLLILKDKKNIITHCNAGPLATSLYGTALGPLILAKEKGMDLHVYVDETRPLLQGARLTTYELDKHGIDVTLICDNMAGMLMNQGKIDACFVGCDRVAANGDTANKIGTLSLAILANHYDIPFYVLGPSSTIDLETKTGDEIVIEERNSEEIRSKWYKEPMAPPVNAYNPAFDVTDHHLINGIITEKGICYSPYEESLSKIFDENDVD
ncbi:MAG: S-methyl-5-thioribose-1-phosphate isomerase [Clostridiaceae bacterium]|nr:S-methyl-5-thioribose-1-phosphate isomerase [Clostridiaceae bacterium]